MVPWFLHRRDDVAPAKDDHCNEGDRGDDAVRRHRRSKEVFGFDQSVFKILPHSVRVRSFNLGFRICHHKSRAHKNFEPCACAAYVDILQYGYPTESLFPLTVSP